MVRLREDVDKYSGRAVPETTIVLFKFLYFLTKTRGSKTIGNSILKHFLEV